MIELLVVLLALVAAYVAVAHNAFVRQQALVAEAQAQVEVELRRRRDLVPQLVEQVRRYEQHEAAVLQEISAANQAQGPDAEERLTRALHALPPLQTGPVQQLQAQIAETEDRIAAARRFERANLRALEVRLQTFPSSLVARLTGVERPDADELTDRERAELELPPEHRDPSSPS